MLIITKAEPRQDSMDHGDAMASHEPTPPMDVKFKIAVVLPNRAETYGLEAENSSYWILDIPIWLFTPTPRWWNLEEIASGTWMPFLRMSPHGTPTVISMHENVSLRRPSTTSTT